MQLLEKYFKNPEIFKFFDKLTSTYCYATVEEAPAVADSAAVEAAPVEAAPAQ